MRNRNASLGGKEWNGEKWKPCRTRPKSLIYLNVIGYVIVVLDAGLRTGFSTPPIIMSISM